ncbi:MAG: hypothetical protein GTO45_13970 [Candidatus Aminicenantes bacterium]|nr:hypothetical protein [Candidatus Aminicenantes bacterium]NIM79875.1 hypothetical protein [Candidatus Aminicenantes bacterium]NIN19212.1 hypothetical protein [Candidatus Aminicenantes bacterium]NIN43117.1 hypothetical protein [Candidatus Aminicenantes bacterium]NIN85854.1 hypothetical protein [Candidatus Aminicenantes bacterium]
MLRSHDVSLRNDDAMLRNHDVSLRNDDAMLRSHDGPVGKRRSEEVRKLGREEGQKIQCQNTSM